MCSARLCSFVATYVGSVCGAVVVCSACDGGAVEDGAVFVDGAACVGSDDGDGVDVDDSGRPVCVVDFGAVDVGLSDQKRVSWQNLDAFEIITVDDGGAFVLGEQNPFLGSDGRDGFFFLEARPSDAGEFHGVVDVSAFVVDAVVVGRAQAELP